MAHHNSSICFLQIDPRRAPLLSM